MSKLGTQQPCYECILVSASDERIKDLKALMLSSPRSLTESIEDGFIVLSDGENGLWGLWIKKAI